MPSRRWRELVSDYPWGDCAYSDIGYVGSVNVLVTIHLVSGTGPSLYFFNCDSVAGANDLEGPSSFVIALRHCRYRCYICAIADTDVTFAPLPIPMLHLRHCRYRRYIDT